MAMYPQVALLLTLILLLAAGDGSLAVGTPSALIRKTCGAIAQTGTEVSYAMCIGLLSANPAAESAKDTRELAVVATNLTVANVTSTVLVLEDLVKNLGECLRIYRAMNRLLEPALGDLRAGHVEAAYRKLSIASGEPIMCDLLLFQGSAMKDPISQENNDAQWLSHLAYAISSLR